MGKTPTQHHISRKGLELPLNGTATTEIDSNVLNRIKSVAVLGDNYLGLRARVHVKEGESVKLGQILFEDRRNSGVQVTSPGAGIVREIHRGERRKLVSIVVDLNDHAGEVTFDIDKSSSKTIRTTMLLSGLWTAFRTRPFDKVPKPEDIPQGIFVSAYNTHPLAPPATAVATDRSSALACGLKVLKKLGDGAPVFLCIKKGDHLLEEEVEGVEVHTFDGPHPAGTPGYQMHTVQPVSRDKVGWHLSLQDTIAIGHLFETGRIDAERIVAITGPGAKQPRLVRARIGSDLDQLLEEELTDENQRVISGSVLGGDRADQKHLSFLGRYHTQVTLLPHPGERQLFGWLAPGIKRFSSLRLFAQKWIPGAQAKFSTDSHGSQRVMIPIGVYDKVFPFDMVATYLLRSLLAGDDEMAESLGCLELSEEDVAPCSFVCPSKIDYQKALRETLNRIEEEG